MEDTGRGVVMEELSEVGGRQVVEGLKYDTKKFEMDALRVGEPVEVFEGVMCSWEAVWVRRWAAEFWSEWQVL